MFPEVQPDDSALNQNIEYQTNWTATSQRTNIWSYIVRQGSDSNSWLLYSEALSILAYSMNI